MTPTEHNAQRDLVRASEYAFRHPDVYGRAEYRARLGKGNDPLAGQRILNERVQGRQIPGTPKVA